MSYFHDELPRIARSSVCDTDEVAKARRLFETFTGHEPQRTQRRRIDRVVPNVLVDLGSLRGLIYSKRIANGAMRTFIHFMENPPRLMCDANGRRLFVIGGTYRITRRGIEG